MASGRQLLEVGVRLVWGGGGATRTYSGEVVEAGVAGAGKVWRWGLSILRFAGMCTVTRSKLAFTPHSWPPPLILTAFPPPCLLHVQSLPDLLCPGSEPTSAWPLSSTALVDARGDTWRKGASVWLTLGPEGQMVVQGECGGLVAHAGGHHPALPNQPTHYRRPL